MSHQKLKGFPNCYAINLEESSDRREYMYDEFNRLGLNGTVIQHKRLENTTYKVDGPNEVIKKLPLGATTSHLLTIKWWYENTDDEIGAFFEDDCDFSTIKYWNFKFDEYLEKMGPVWDGLQLCVMHEGWPVMVPRVRMGWDHGLQCYIIRRHYAKRIIDYYFKSDNEIHLRMPYVLKQETDHKTGAGGNKRYRPTIENIVYGLGIFIIHPLFNHNITQFKTTVHNQSSEAKFLQHIAEKSEKYVREWWQRKGQHGSLEELFSYEWNCPTRPGQIYGHIHPRYT